MAACGSMLGHAHPALIPFLYRCWRLDAAASRAVHRRKSHLLHCYLPLVDRTTGLYDTRTSCMLCRPVPSFRFDVQCDPTNRELTAGVVLRADSGASTASSLSVDFDSCPFLRRCRLHRPVKSLVMTSRQCTVNLPMRAFLV
jgi:hypothetical protein